MARRPPPESADDEESTTLVRLTVGIKSAVREAAKKEGKSVNAWIVDTLAAAAGMCPEPVTVVVGTRWRKESGAEVQP